jgi:bifunctional ADP-heptose synthase (sugar kinase/adenylyltransferase)
MLIFTILVFGLAFWGQQTDFIIIMKGTSDIFCASLAVALKDGKSIREASAWACKVAGLSVSKQGTISSYPTLKEVNSIIK